MADEQQIYDYDEFFVPSGDGGVEIQVPINGRTVPIRVKRGLTLGDVKSAQSRAVIQKINPAGGIEVTGYDEDKFSQALMQSAIISWPFKKNVGDKESPRWVDVPVTTENIKALLAEGGAYIEKYLTSKMQGAQAQAAPLENQ